MTSTAVPRTGRHLDLPDPNFVHPEVLAPETRSATAARYVGAALRISLGWVFLWAFIDKLFGLGFATEKASSWLNGGSPTEGFLSFGTQGPLAGVFQAMAGYAIVDWIFMLGLLGIGAALMLGVGVRIAAVSGALMMVMMWAAALWPANNPFMDDHLIYAGLLAMLALSYSGRTLGLGARWEATALVRRFRWLV